MSELTLWSKFLNTMNKKLKMKMINKLQNFKPDGLEKIRDILKNCRGELFKFKKFKRRFLLW